MFNVDMGEVFGKGNRSVLALITHLDDNSSEVKIVLLQWNLSCENSAYSDSC